MGAVKLLDRYLELLAVQPPPSSGTGGSSTRTSIPPSDWAL